MVQSEEIEMEQRNERNRASLPPLIDNRIYSEARDYEVRGEKNLRRTMSQ